MEQADKERNRLLLVKHIHIHNTKPYGKTHFLILAMEQADKERNRSLFIKINMHTCTTQDHSVKLTSYCWQYMEQAGKKKKRLL